MRVARYSRRRRGIAAVEFALVAPVVLILIFGQIVGGLGASRYQEVAHLAREGARYASTHGGLYLREGRAQTTGVPSVTGSSELSTYLAGKSVLLDPSRLNVNVAWTAPNTLTPINMPTYVDTNPSQVPPGQKVVQNNVIVTVTYQWFPEAFPIGPFTLTSTSQMPMSY
ncbi:MAG: TadE/TadG family type IV pilus assembly protein [Pirellulaceae bacterium]